MMLSSQKKKQNHNFQQFEFINRYPCQELSNSFKEIEQEMRSVEVTITDAAVSEKLASNLPVNENI